MVERILEAVKDVARSGKLSSTLTTWILGQDVGYDGWRERQDLLREIIRSAIEASAEPWTVVLLTPPGRNGVVGAIQGAKLSDAKIEKFAKQLESWYSGAPAKTAPPFRTKQVNALTAIDAINAANMLWQFRQTRDEIIQDGAAQASAWIHEAKSHTEEKAKRSQAYEIKRPNGERVIGNATDVLRTLALDGNIIVADGLAKISALPIPYVDGEQVSLRSSVDSPIREIWTKALHDVKPLDQREAEARLREGAWLGADLGVWGRALYPADAEGAALRLRAYRVAMSRFGASDLWTTGDVHVDIYERLRLPVEMIWYVGGAAKLHVKLAEGYSYASEMISDLKTMLRLGGLPEYYAWIYCAGPTTRTEAASFVPDIDYMRANGSREIGVVARVPNAHTSTTDYWTVVGTAQNFRAEPTSSLEKGLMALENAIPGGIRDAARSPRLISAVSLSPLPDAAKQIEDLLVAAQAAVDGDREGAALQALNKALAVRWTGSGNDRSAALMGLPYTSATMSARIFDLERRAIKHYSDRWRVVSARATALRQEAEQVILGAARPVLDALNTWTDPASDFGRKSDSTSLGVVIYPVDRLDLDQRVKLIRYGLNIDAATHLGIGSDGHRAMMEAVTLPAGALPTPVLFDRTSVRGDWRVKGEDDGPLLTTITILPKHPVANAPTKFAVDAGVYTMILGVRVRSSYLKATSKFLGGAYTMHAESEPNAAVNGPGPIAFAKGNRVALMMPALLRGEES